MEWHRIPTYCPFSPSTFECFIDSRQRSHVPRERDNAITSQSCTWRTLSTIDETTTPPVVLHSRDSYLSDQRAKTEDISYSILATWVLTLDDMRILCLTWIILWRTIRCKISSPPIHW